MGDTFYKLSPLFYKNCTFSLKVQQCVIRFESKYYILKQVFSVGISDIAK